MSQFPSDAAERFQLRLPEGMRDRLKEEAANNNRSMNSEIISRLEDSFNKGQLSISDQHLIERLEGDMRRSLWLQSEEGKRFVIARQCLATFKDLFRLARDARSALPDAKSIVPPLPLLEIEKHLAQLFQLPADVFGAVTTKLPPAPISEDGAIGDLDESIKEKLAKLEKSMGVSATKARRRGSLSK